MDASAEVRRLQAENAALRDELERLVRVPSQHCWVDHLASAEHHLRQQCHMHQPSLHVARYDIAGICSSQTLVLQVFASKWQRCKALQDRNVF